MKKLTKLHKLVTYSPLNLKGSNHTPWLYIPYRDYWNRWISSRNRVVDQSTKAMWTLIFIHHLINSLSLSSSQFSTPLPVFFFFAWISGTIWIMKKKNAISANLYKLISEYCLKGALVNFSLLENFFYIHEILFQALNSSAEIERMSYWVSERDSRRIF